MKNIAIIGGFLFLTLGVNAQWCNYLNFEDTATANCVEIDTLLVNNLWEIGQPSKLYFDTAYTSPNAIMTDTLGYYSNNNASSFQFRVGTQNNYCGMFLSYFHKYDTDSFSDGGTVELSMDNGLTWRPFLTNVYDSISIIPWGLVNYVDSVSSLGIPGYTGKSNGWEHEYTLITWTPYHPDSIIFRFTFKSDSINNDKEGWLIDNIYVEDELCPSVGEINSEIYQLNVFPNPVGNLLNIELVNWEGEPWNWKLYNGFGQQVAERDQISDQLQFVFNANFANGIYCYIIRTDNKVAGSGRIILEQ